MAYDKELDEAFEHYRVLIINGLQQGLTYHQVAETAEIEAKAKLNDLLRRVEVDSQLIKPGELIPYETIKGKDYVKLEWLTDKLKATPPQPIKKED